MEELKRKRPMLATLLCIATALWMAYSLHWIPYIQQPAPEKGAILLQMAPPWYWYTTFGTNFILSLCGIISLWLMRPVAAAFYAGGIVTTVIAEIVSIIYLHEFEATRMFYTVPGRPDAHPSMPGWAIWVIFILTVVLTVGIRVTLFLYVRWVTMGAAADGAVDAAGEKFTSHPLR